MGSDSDLRAERLKAHDVALPKGYLPDPDRHLGNVRDRIHYDRALRWLKSLGAKSALDVGSYDGWLDFLLIRDGFKMSGVEMIGSLANAAMSYAERNFIQYQVFTNHILDAAPLMFSEGGEKYDAVLCFETLEHLPLDEAKEAVGKFSSWASKGVIISLPDQKHEDNAQHLWTPTADLIHEMWGRMPGYDVEYVPYPGSHIPGNWFIRYRLG